MIGSHEPYVIENVDRWGSTESLTAIRRTANLVFEADP